MKIRHKYVIFGSRIKPCYAMFYFKNHYPCFSHNSFIQKQFGSIEVSLDSYFKYVQVWFKCYFLNSNIWWPKIDLEVRTENLSFRFIPVEHEIFSYWSYSTGWIFFSTGWTIFFKLLIMLNRLNFFSTGWSFTETNFWITKHSWLA